MRTREFLKPANPKPTQKKRPARGGWKQVQFQICGSYLDEFRAMAKLCGCPFHEFLRMAVCDAADKLRQDLGITRFSGISVLKASKRKRVALSKRFAFVSWINRNSHLDHRN